MLQYLWEYFLQFVLKRGATNTGNEQIRNIGECQNIKSGLRTFVRMDLIHKSYCLSYHLYILDKIETSPPVRISTATKLDV